MLRSLKSRLAFSHTLPILLVVALLGLALLYQLERYYLLDNLVVELTAQAALVAEFTRDETPVWTNPAAAQSLVEQLRKRVSSRLMLVDANGQVIASSWYADDYPPGTFIESPVVSTALSGNLEWALRSTPDSPTPIVDVAAPVIVSPGRIVGVVRMSQNLDEIRRRLAPVRWLIGVTLLIGGGVALVLGLFLARSLSQPLLQLTAAVSRYTPLAKPESVPEVGPDETRKLAASFNHLTARLYELERTRAALLSGVVHELARPLGAMKAAAQTIHNHPDLRSDVELAAGIDEHIDQLRVQLDDLVLLGELEFHGLTIQPEPIDLPALLADQLRQFTPMAASKNITLTLDDSTPPDPTLHAIPADPKRLAQIIGNLLHNACKYTPEGGRVTLSTGVELPALDFPGYALVHVADTGPGVSLSETERIFDFFYRSPAHRRIHQGMGIGLALARRLAEAHGGSLTVAPNDGDPSGARFTLRLPLAP